MKMRNSLLVGVCVAIGCQLIGPAVSSGDYFTHIYQFQQGRDLNGNGVYSDACDIAIDDPNRNDPTDADRLRVRYYSNWNDEVHSSLIRFGGTENEVSFFLQGQYMAILSASVTLTYQDEQRSYVPADIDIYPITQYWSDADWFYAQFGQLWTEDGAKHQYDDRGENMDPPNLDGYMGYRDFIDRYPDNTPYEFYLDTDVVLDWIENPSTNYGFIVTMNPDRNTSCTFSSSEDPCEEYRPLLTIVMSAANAVPDVFGETLQDACDILAIADFEVGTVVEVYQDGDDYKGKVVEQDPCAYELAPFGSAVDLKISLGIERVAVPNLIGYTPQDACAIIIANDLEPCDVLLSYTHPTVPAGRIAYQDPCAGFLAPLGAFVQLAVSEGPYQLTVPGVVGLDEALAEQIIISTGLPDHTPLYVGAKNRAYDDNVPEGEVISQDPTSGAIVNEGSAVDLTISKGKPQVPDVIGYYQGQAQAIIVNAGLQVGTVTQEYHDTVWPGIVFGQQPCPCPLPDEYQADPCDPCDPRVCPNLDPCDATRCDVQVEDAIDIWVSLGLENVAIPNVIGMPKDQAEMTMTNSQLSFSTSLGYGTAATDIDFVGWLNPPAGTVVPAQSIVDIYLVNADFDGNGNVGSEDFDVFLSEWLDCVNPPGYPDLNGDACLDLSDFALFATHWLDGL